MPGVCPRVQHLTPLRLAASFRDPSGFVFRRDGRLLRQVNESYRDEYDLLIGSGLYDALAGPRRLVPHDELPVTTEAATPGAYRVQPEPVPFISYPYEWCFSQLRDAALLTLEIQEHAAAVDSRRPAHDRGHAEPAAHAAVPLPGGAAGRHRAEVRAGRARRRRGRTALRLRAPARTHEPYIFEEDCTHREPYWPPTDYVSDQQPIRDAYIAQVACLNRKLISLVQTILAAPGTRPIILLQADHGHGLISVDPVYWGNFYLLLELTRIR